MAQHGFAIERAEDFGRAAIFHLELRREALVGIQFANIRPEVDTTTARLEPVPASPMSPASGTAIGGSAKPALVSAHYFPRESVSIHTFMALALVGLHGVFDDRLAIHSIWIAPVLVDRRKFGCMNYSDQTKGGNGEPFHSGSYDYVSHFVCA